MDNGIILKRRTKKITKTRAEINEIENKRYNGKTTKPKVGSLRKSKWLNSSTCAHWNNTLQ